MACRMVYHIEVKFQGSVSQQGASPCLATLILSGIYYPNTGRSPTANVIQPILANNLRLASELAGLYFADDAREPLNCITSSICPIFCFSLSICFMNFLSINNDNMMDMFFTKGSNRKLFELKNRTVIF